MWYSAIYCVEKLNQNVYLWLYLPLNLAAHWRASPGADGQMEYTLHVQHRPESHIVKSQYLQGSKTEKPQGLHY